MRANLDCYDIARQMLTPMELHPDGIPPKLFAMITDVDQLCMKAGGELRSRQVIATLIVLWRQNP